MKRTLLATLILALPTGAGFGQERHPCYETAMSQLELNDCAGVEFRQLDGEMNRAYNALLDRHREDEAFVAALKKTQEAWLVYRDAHVDSHYPEICKREYGSIRPMCQAWLLTQLTRQRLVLLREMLDPNESEEACAFPLAPVE